MKHYNTKKYTTNSNTTKFLIYFRHHQSNMNELYQQYFKDTSETKSII